MKQKFRILVLLMVSLLAVTGCFGQNKSSATTASEQTQASTKANQTRTFVDSAGRKVNVPKKSRKSLLQVL